MKSFERSRFDQNLQDLETELEHFKLRYRDFVADWEAYQALQARIEADTPVDPTIPSPNATTLEQTQQDLLKEYDRLRERLQGIETRWESQFFSWDGFGTVFWQVVRFLGLGILLGWWLRGCAG